MAQQTLYLLGDINFKGIQEERGLFDDVIADVKSADMVFANLECCLYDLPDSATERRGFYVHPRLGKLLVEAGVQVVGNANNVNIGHEAIRASLSELDRLQLRYVGAGLDDTSARSPLVVDRDGVRYGFLQRTAVYWPDNHEAAVDRPGVAVIKGGTAYRPKLELQSARTRPGVPPEVLTWADPDSLAQYRKDIAALREQADVVIASFHWGYQREVLAYQREFAYAAIDGGCDIVLGHGPHVILPIEIRHGKPIFYGMGNYSFQMAHSADDFYAKWVGMTARIEVVNGGVGDIRLDFVRRGGSNETLPCLPSDEPVERDLLLASSQALGTAFEDCGDHFLLRHGGSASFNSGKL